MAKRYSGDLVITVTWDDARDAYKATVNRAGAPAAHAWRGWVGAPRALRFAVDSPEAYDDAAHAALSFADDEFPGEFGDHADPNADDSGWHISRVKPGHPMNAPIATTEHPFRRGEIVQVRDRFAIITVTFLEARMVGGEIHAIVLGRDGVTYRIPMYRVSKEGA